MINIQPSHRVANSPGLTRILRVSALDPVFGFSASISGLRSKLH